MRKLAHIDAPKVVVTHMFCNIRRWTAWMPGVESVSLLEESPHGAVALIRQRRIGRSSEQKWAFRFGDSRLDQRQLTGLFRRWENHWRFLDSPDGEGTTAQVDISFELGLLDRLLPSRLVQENLDRMFDEIVNKARARARAILAEETLSTPTSIGEQPLLQVHQTGRGLELRVAGRRYHIPAMPDD